MSQVSLQLSNHQNLEELLRVTVEIAIKTLKCDRVIVYSTSHTPKATVLAESVVAECASVLGKTIIDPFLENQHLEIYSYGRAIAIDNIYDQQIKMYSYGQTVAINNVDTAKLSKIDLEQIEKLKIKSLAYAPILNGSKLVAVLVAHQCFEPRPWEPEAMNFLIEIARAAGFALLNKAKGEKSHNSAVSSADSLEQSELDRSQSTASIQTSVNSPSIKTTDKGTSNGKLLSTETEMENEIKRKLAKAVDQEDILQTAVREIRYLLKCDRVLIYDLAQAEGEAIAESVALGWSKALGTKKLKPLPAQELEQYRHGQVRAWKNIDDSRASEDFEPIEALEIKARAVAPILNQNRLFGLLVAHQCSAPHHWQQSELNLIGEIATQIGLMLKLNNTSNDNETQQKQTLLAEEENRWNQLLTDAIQYIRQSLNQEDILKTSVKEVRRVLECDRVVIYSQNPDRYGTVVAESVAPGWTKALGRVIEDPCFEARYLDQYRSGRVRAWSNIYEAGMTKCYIDQLEKLQVKANLVTPIINEGKLFGLLVAHQCSAPRDWRAAEIRWTAQVATQIGLTLDNAKLLADAKSLQQQLKEEKNLTRYFTDAIRYIRQSLQEENILEVSVEEVRRVLNCDRVLVYSLEQGQDRYGTVIAESVAPGWTRAVGKKIDDPCFEPSYREKYRNGRVRAWNNIYESGMTQCYIELLEKLEVKANLITPIINEDKLFGLFVAHQCSDFRHWRAAEIRWVTQIATQVGFALDNAKLLVDAKRLQQQLDSESQWTEYFTDAVQQIRRSLKTEDVLKTSVKEVRRVLECDRVVIYSQNPDRYGEIVAESVAPGWTRALGRVIEDPCFEARYLDQYRNGRVRAWSNIYEAGMSQCYTDQLEKLEVKANLVAPIINEGNLFGLLVAHQCSTPRDWRTAEIRWVAQIATQVGFALDNAKLIEQLHQSTQTSNQLSHQQQQSENLKHQIVKILAENGDAYKSLSQQAMRQSETTIEVLQQIQGVANAVSGIALNFEQIKLQEQQSDLVIRTTQDSLNRAINSISGVQNTVLDISVGLDNINQSCQQLSKTVHLIKDLSKQIVQKSINMTRVVNRSQVESNDQSYAIDLSDTVFSLMQKLFEVSARVEPLLGIIRSEVRDKTDSLDSKTKQLVGGVGEFQAVQQNLERVASLNRKMNNLVGQIAQVTENQSQTSTFAQQSVQEVASIAESISEQSMAITQSFNQLIDLVQQL